MYYIYLKQSNNHTMI